MTRKVVLVCGGRDYYNWLEMNQTLDAIDTEDAPISLLINGAARGADKMSTNWALSNGTDCREYPANWNKHGKRAGSIRNQQMLDEGQPDLVVAFPGGSGTADMVRRASQAHITILQVHPA